MLKTLNNKNDSNDTNDNYNMLQCQALTVFSAYAQNLTKPMQGNW